MLLTEVTLGTYANITSVCHPLYLTTSEIKLSNIIYFHPVSFLFLLLIFNPDRLYLYTKWIFTLPYCRNIVSPCPEMPVSPFCPVLRMPVKKHQRTLLFQIWHEFRYTYLRRYCNIHMKWSLHTRPSIRSTCFISHSFLMIAAKSFLVSPYIIFLLYFGIKTICRYFSPCLPSPQGIRRSRLSNGKTACWNWSLPCRLCGFAGWWLRQLHAPAIFLPRLLSR